MSKKLGCRIVMLMFLTLVLLFAVSCSKKEPVTETGPSLTGELNIWSFLTQKERAEELENLAKAYETARPGVTTLITVAPWAGALDKIVASIMAGNPPDITVVGNGFPQVLAGTGGLMETSNLINDMGGPDAFLGPALDLGICEDSGNYAIPLYVTPYVAYYRESWLDAAGITKLPATWEEYYTMCKAVTDPAKSRYGFGVPLSDHHGWKTIWSLLQSNEVDLLNRDSNGNWIVDISDTDRRAIAEVYDFLNRLVKDCSPAGAVSYNQQNIRELVAQGTIMSRIDTPEIYYNVREMDPDNLADVKYFAFPGRKTIGSGFGWTSMSIPVKGNTVLASDFIKFIYEDERMIPFYNSYPYAMFPGKKSHFESIQYRNNLPEEVKAMVPDMALEILSHSTGLAMANGPFPGAGEFESRKTLTNPLNSMLINGFTAERAVNQLIEELEDLVR